MSHPSTPIVIIGSGLAGINVAKNWRKLNSTRPLIIITQDSGDSYSKPMLSTAFAKSQDAQSLIQQSATELADTLTCNMITNTSVDAIDPEQQLITLDTGKTIQYHKLVLALGATANKPQLEGDACDTAITINNLQDYAAFRERCAIAQHITVVGGGLVGCELANDLSYSSMDVALYNSSEHLLSNFLPKQIGERLAIALETKSARVHNQVSITDINHTSEKRLRVTDSNDGSHLTDLVITATGLSPNTALALKSGLTTSNGIQTNQYLETSSPNIYALGDCANICGHNLLYVLPLMNSARALAKTLEGEGTAVQLPAMPVTIKTSHWPITVLPPSSDNSQGIWVDIESSSAGQEWHFMAEDKLLGFALAGQSVSKKNALAKQCPALDLG